MNFAHKKTVSIYFLCLHTSEGSIYCGGFCWTGCGAWLSLDVMRQDMSSICYKGRMFVEHIFFMFFKRVAKNSHKMIIQTQKQNPNILQYPEKSSNISSKYVLLTFFLFSVLYLVLSTSPRFVSRRVTTAQTTDTTRATDRGSRNPKGITSPRCCHVKSLVFLTKIPHDWEWKLYTTYKNGDFPGGWFIVCYGIVLPTLPHLSHV